MHFFKFEASKYFQQAHLYSCYGFLSSYMLLSSVGFLNLFNVLFSDIEMECNNYKYLVGCFAAKV